MNSQEFASRALPAERPMGPVTTPPQTLGLHPTDLILSEGELWAF